MAALEHDAYDNGGADISVTGLINSPRILILQKKNKELLEMDARDKMWSFLGTAVHAALEAHVPENAIAEERLFVEFNGWKISGAIDLQIDNGDGTWEINDYKVVGEFSVRAEKDEWVQQLNIYAYMMRIAKGRRVTKLRIIAFLRDWSRRKAEMDSSYPQSMICPVDIPLWSDEEQEEYFRQRVSIHQSAEKDVAEGRALVLCTDKERWHRPGLFALMKKGRKSAVKLYDTKEEAENAAGTNEDHYVEERTGSDIRCEGNWCQVRDWCKYWIEKSGSGAGGSPD